jgi:plastocyanin
MFRKGAGARKRAGRPVSWGAAALVAATLIAGTAALVIGCSPRTKLHRVTIRAFRFEPATLTVAAGDTVQWDNQDIVPHTSTHAQVWDSGTIAPRKSWRWVANRRGSLDYMCTFHTNMKAIVVVQ